MKRAKKEKKLVSLLLVMLLVSGCGREMWYSTSSLEKLELVESDKNRNGICYVYAKERKGVPDVIEDQYLIERESQGERTDEYYAQEFQVYNLKLYDIQGELLHSYTIEDFHKLCQTAGWFTGSYYVYIKYEGKIYIVFRYYEAVQEDPYGMDAESRKALEHLFYLDPQTGELGEFRKEEWEKFKTTVEKREKEHKEYILLYRDEFIQANGYQHDYDPEEDVGKWIDFFYCAEGEYVDITTETSCLPESGRLYERFPGLKDWQGKEGYYLECRFWNDPSVEELMELFLEEGEEVSFDGVRVTEEESVDGKPHAINSFEDFNKWYVRKDEREKSDE